MNSLKKLNQLYLPVAAAIILAISIFGVIAYTNWLGISVSLQTINPHDQIGPYETLTLTFSQAVLRKDVEDQLQLQPDVEGKLEWQNDYTLRFTPAKPYSGTLTVRLLPRQIGVNGDWMRREASWILTVRRSLIVYINYAEPKNELMVIPVEGGSARQLTSTGGKIFDFDVSRSGGMIVYSVINDRQGVDLWLVDRNGQNPRRLLDCGADRCSSVSWSPDGQLIAYSRQLPGVTEEDPKVHLWMINVETAKAQPVFSDPQAFGSGALWSPDGNWLATYDPKAVQIRAINLKTRKEALLPNNSKSLGSWSPDGAFLIYPDYTIGADGAILQNSLSLVDFKTVEIKSLLNTGSDNDNYRYGNPIWSPGGNQIALSMRSVRHRIPRLWVVRADKPEEVIMMAASGYSYNFYQWDMWGSGLVVEQLNLGKANPPEIAIWYPQQGYRVLAVNGIFPRWLP